MRGTRARQKNETAKINNSDSPPCCRRLCLRFVQHFRLLLLPPLLNAMVNQQSFVTPVVTGQTLWMTLLSPLLSGSKYHLFCLKARSSKTYFRATGMKDVFTPVVVSGHEFFDFFATVGPTALHDFALRESRDSGPDGQSCYRGSNNAEMTLISFSSSSHTAIARLQQQRRLRQQEHRPFCLYVHSFLYVLTDDKMKHQDRHPQMDCDCYVPYSCFLLCQSSWRWRHGWW
jgi:hypothetical protein